MIEKHDSAWFDGSCDPNPSGRMGAGWRLLWRDRPEQTGSQEWPASPANTVNVAEYSALIGLLSDYHAGGGTGPLMIYGDSQLVIRQMTGEYSVRSPALFDLNQEASAFVHDIAGGVSFRWIPREQNQRADTLASGDNPDTPAPTLYANCAPQGSTPQGVSPAVAKEITRLNQQGRMSFKEAMNLRVGGRDFYSGKYLRDLAGPAGTTCVEAIRAAFPANIKAQETALRWACRGLAVHLAIRKVQVDAEVKDNAEKGRSREW